MSVLGRMLRLGDRRMLRTLETLPAAVGAHEPTTAALSDGDLQAQTGEFRRRVDRGEPLDGLLVEAFAVVREAAQRVLGQRPYDVQLIGGAALHHGRVAQMHTGEGKTLVSALPAYLNGLTGDGVHLITVNDYLARRDATAMGRLHRWLGLSVGLVTAGATTAADRRRNYRCDLTYGTTAAMGFDYLRDNMATHPHGQVQRGHAYAIVDEIDSVLIDEARTPLVISGSSRDDTGLYRRFARITAELDDGVHFDVDEQHHTVVPTEAGIEQTEAALGISNLYADGHQHLVHHLAVALNAKALYRPGRDYLVRNGEVVIIDQFTGRTLPGRRWNDGLHQAVEAKEQVGVQPENHTLATVTVQNYFRMYRKLAGMTGTAAGEAAEFSRTYGLDVVTVPPHRPMRRIDHPDLIFRTEADKFAAIVDEVATRSHTGQPVLVGTVSVEKSEHLSALLARRGIPHQVLNANRHDREADIIAQAGRPGAVTVATNMAGRGVDILLGGNPDGLTRRALLDAGVDPALLDDTEHPPDGPGGDDPDRAAIRARYREVLDQQHDICRGDARRVRDLGGLYVIGTERHESRRIDNQLRGRAGRQGDPGESRFYLSLDDDLLRVFASDRVYWTLARSLPDHGPLESRLVARAMERAQRAVEARNAQQRETIVDYDAVYDAQRKVVYAHRNLLLGGADLQTAALGMVCDTARAVVEDHRDDPQRIAAALNALLGCDLDEAMFPGADDDDWRSIATYEARARYLRRAQTLGAQRAPLERSVLLAIIDRCWRDHLVELDHLRDGIGLRAIAQKDPLVEWRREGFAHFAAMLARVACEFTERFLADDPHQPPKDVEARPPG